MSKTTAFFRLTVILVVALLFVGLLGYIFPETGQRFLGASVQREWHPWDKHLSPFVEQDLLQQKYATDLQQKITMALEQLVGEKAVHSSVSVQLGLTEMTNREKKSKTVIRSIAQDVYAVSVVVLMDTPKDHSKNQIYHPLSKVQLKRYTDIVKTIIGYNPVRGDKVLVLNQPFVPSAGKSKIQWANTLFWGVFLTLTGILLILLILSLWPTQSVQYPRRSVLAKVKEMCFKFPEQIADILKRWISDGRMEDACIVILAVGTERSKLLFRYLKQSEIHQIVRYIRRLGKIPPKLIYRALHHLIREFMMPSSLQGSDRQIKDLLHEVPNAADIYAEIKASGAYQTLWDKFNAMETDDLIRFLKTQPPETVAFILFHLSDSVSGKVLQQLPEGMGQRILLHLKHIRSMGRHVRYRLIGQISREFYHFTQTETAGMQKISSIMATLSETARQQFAETQSHRIKSWSDVLSLSTRQRIHLLTYLDLTVLAAALADRAPEEQQLFAEVLSDEQWQSVVEKNPSVDQGEQARHIMIKTAQELFG